MIQFLMPRVYTAEELGELSEASANRFVSDRHRAEEELGSHYHDCYNLFALESKGQPLLVDGLLSALRNMDRPTVSEDDFKSSSRSAPMAKLSVPKPRAKTGINDEGSVPMAKRPSPKLALPERSVMFCSAPMAKHPGPKRLTCRSNSSFCSVPMAKHPVPKPDAINVPHELGIQFQGPMRICQASCFDDPLPAFMPQLQDLHRRDFPPRRR